MADKNIYTVVVADDEDELREAVCTMIPWEALGFHLVGNASNGLDALELVERLEPDLLLTDIRMPFISGIELARQVREIRPAMHIAFLSGFDDFEYAKQAIQYNIISYMLKPLTMDGLAAELKAIHEKIDARYAGLRRADSAHADRAALIIPLVLARYENAPENLETRLRQAAVDCGLLRGTDDRSTLVVMAAALDGPVDYEAGFTQLVDQSANKYLRHFVFYGCGRAVALLLGNPSDFEEYLHILADEICQLADRALGRSASVGVSREFARFSDLNDAYKQAIEALRAAADGEGGVSFTADARKTGSLCERALEIIEQHYMDEDLSLASLSAMLDVSPNHLSACIKKSEGETFINILVRRRMETAQTLLLTTDLQIQEIARRCGYTDQHYFSYCFKKYSGTSPVALRRARAAGELGPPCVGTSFRASTASGLWHSPPRPPVPPGRRVSRLRQDDRTYIYVCIPGSGICFGILRHRATPAAHYIATRLHAYRATRRRPAERREGRPWTPSGHALIFERGAVRASRKPSAFAGLFAKLCGAAENPRLRRGTPSAFPRTHCAIINR